MEPFERGWERKDVWVTKDCRVLKPQEMEDNHLISTICFLRYKAPALKEIDDIEFVMMKTPSGDAASLAFEQEQIALLDMSPQRWLEETHIYQLLMKEAEQRHLELPEADLA